MLELKYSRISYHILSLVHRVLVKKILINFLSCKYKVRNGVLVTSVKSQHNTDPDYGVTQYENTLISYLIPHTRPWSRGRVGAVGC